jgi:hypothetical protein
MTRKAPASLAELFAFYNAYVKLLHSLQQTENVLSQETLFELNAALDHLARHWVYGEPEGEVVVRTYGHLKRSCLDVFKTEYKRVVDQYNELNRVDTSLIDAGRYDSRLHQVMSELKAKATDARRRENLPDSEDAVPCFEEWEKVLAGCERFRKEFFLNPDVERARKKSRLYSLKSFVWGPS